MLVDILQWVLRIYLLYTFCTWAYTFRLHAINQYGPVIHEFDPWFNFRATQYLHDNGWTSFFHWFDYMSWYPLGRPVGTTIYPGMQITAVVLHRVLNDAAATLNIPALAMSLNDVCCYIPAWFGVSASLFLGLLTLEGTRSYNAAVAAVGVMAIIPAHMMRSVGGGYDNESVATTAMVMTFFLWARALRNDSSWWIGALTGLSYTYMAAVWGGYIFVLNMIVVSAAVLVALGRFSPGLHKAYTLWYIIGTFGATRVPVVGMAPLKSLEQLSGLVGLIGLQLIAYCEAKRKKQELGWGPKAYALYTKVFGAVAMAVVAVIVVLAPTGYFGPLSSRVRGLFLKHTRTGNPLVDSGAEHQPASKQAYWQYLHYAMNVAPFGATILAFKRTNGSTFVVLYGLVTYFFSSKMMRLILLTGPAAAACSGAFIGLSFDWCLSQFIAYYNFISSEETEEEEEQEEEDSSKSSKSPAKDSNLRNRKGGKAKDDKAAAKDDSQAKKKKGKKATATAYERVMGPVEQGANEFYQSKLGKAARVSFIVSFFYGLYVHAPTFYEYSFQLSQQLSNPIIMYYAQTGSGQRVLVDDYRESYFWLRDNTPEDSRVMAWWDYGYQITGIGNRTSIADGNTWNHEHIAALGRCLTSEEKMAHSMIRHLADYVLVWAGGGGDDLAKSPHLARIGNSVFGDLCPNDPTCQEFGFYGSRNQPTPLMAKSLLYKLHQNGYGGVEVNKKLFAEVFRSKYGKVRIYKVKSVSKKSKEWNADPANRLCDAPGSWYCAGQYPPALKKQWQKQGVEQKAFAQLEDFNAKKTDADAAYQKAYFERMEGRAPSKPAADARASDKPKQADPEPEAPKKKKGKKGKKKAEAE
jgi:dolichyl-diphosphooligosaccharide--protein glycosyltransferase